MYIETIKIKGEKIATIIDLIKSDIRSISFNPVEEVYIFMSEKLYFRNNAQLMSCLIVKIEDKENCMINIVSGGGSIGIFGIDYGAEASRGKEIKTMFQEICKENNWILEKQTQSV